MLAKVTRCSRLWAAAARQRTASGPCLRLWICPCKLHDCVPPTPLSNYVACNELTMAMAVNRRGGVTVLTALTVLTVLTVASSAALGPSRSQC